MTPDRDDLLHLEPLFSCSQHRTILVESIMAHSRGDDQRSECFKSTIWGKFRVLTALLDSALKTSAIEAACALCESVVDGEIVVDMAT